MKSAALAWRGMLEGIISPAKGESMTDQEAPERAHVTADDIEAANDLIDFIEACPSMFHTAATIMAELDEAGFTYLPENAAWDIEPGGRYYTQRNTSSVIAFKVGEDLAATWGEDGVAGDYHFQLTASHSDSPTFKVKAVPELDGAGETLRLNTEAYGGMVSTPGSIARWHLRAACWCARATVSRAACSLPSAKLPSFRALPSI